jgi:predicted transcriptional regulator
MDILKNIFMATSVYIPKSLLEAVDRRARALKVSRNKLIIQALEREVTAGADWPAGFFDKLATADAELLTAVDDMSKAISTGRKSKSR